MAHAGGGGSAADRVALDDGDWRIALDSARAKTATAQATLARIDSQVEAARAAQLQAQAQQNSAEAAVTRTAADFDRASSLAAKSYGSQATLDAATAARDQAIASLASAKAGVVQAQANIKVLEAQRIEAGPVSVPFAIDPEWRTKLLNGWDDIDLTRSHLGTIAAFMEADRERRPWMQPGMQPSLPDRSAP